MGNLHINAGHIWRFSPSNAFHRLIGSFKNWDGLFKDLSSKKELLIKPVNDLPEMIVIDKLICLSYKVIGENLRKLKKK